MCIQHCLFGNFLCSPVGRRLQPMRTLRGPLHPCPHVTITSEVARDNIFISFVYSELDQYDIQRCSEPVMLKFYAFASCVIELLGRGLDTFSLSRYRQLNKRIARIIKYVQCLWFTEMEMFQPPKNKSDSLVKTHLPLDIFFNELVFDFIIMSHNMMDVLGIHHLIISDIFHVEKKQKFNFSIYLFTSPHREVVHCVSDHWENYSTTFSSLPAATIDRLQLEFDQVFFRATSAILSAQRYTY